MNDTESYQRKKIKFNGLQKHYADELHNKIFAVTFGNGPVLKPTQEEHRYRRNI